MSEEFNYLVVTNTGIPLLVSGGIPIRRYSEFSGDYWLYDIESKVVASHHSPKAHATGKTRSLCGLLLLEKQNEQR